MMALLEDDAVLGRLLFESDLCDEDTTDSSSDCDNEVVDAIVALTRTERNAIKNYSEITVISYNDNEFKTHFRTSKELMNSLVEHFAESQMFLQHFHTKGKDVVEPRKHLEVFLWYVGHSCTYIDVSDRFNITVSTVFEIITRINAFFDEMAAEVIKWPSQQHIQQTKAEVFRRTRFPGVIGFIDGTHIKIDRPRKHQESYCNRKHYHSIQVQIICDDKCKIMDAFIGYPGSVHDARVFSSSFIFPQLSELCQDGHLLGDSAYPCLDFCLTPYKDNGHLTRMQTRYNTVHSSIRIKVEHANGILKQRFRQLYHVKLRKIDRVVALVKSCCVLHNLCQIQDKLLFDCEHNPLDVTTVHDANITVADPNMNLVATSGVAKRNYIASML